MKKKKYTTSGSSMIDPPSRADRVIDVIVVILCGLVAFCSVIPLWHVLMLSFSDGKTAYASEGLALIPLGGFNLDGWKNFFQYDGIIRGYINTIFYTVTSTALGWFLSVTAGYAMSRQTKLRGPMTMFVMFTMLFGGGMIPTYMVVRSLGWVGNPLSLIIPGCTNAMFCVMMMNAFMGVPKEMYEAARIDGAGHFRTMFSVMLPQVGNMSAVIILNSVVGVWNSWLNASIYVPNATEWWPLQLVIRQITANNSTFLQTSNPDYSRYLIQYCAIIASSLPIIIMFPFFQDKMERATITGGVKQ